MGDLNEFIETYNKITDIGESLFADKLEQKRYEKKQRRIDTLLDKADPTGKNRYTKGMDKDGNLSYGFLTPEQQQRTQFYEEAMKNTDNVITGFDGSGNPEWESQRESDLEYNSGVMDYRASSLDYDIKKKAFDSGEPDIGDQIKQQTLTNKIGVNTRAERDQVIQEEKYTASKEAKKSKLISIEAAKNTKSLNTAKREEIVTREADVAANLLSDNKTLIEIASELKLRGNTTLKERKAIIEYIKKLQKETKAETDDDAEYRSTFQ